MAERSDEIRREVEATREELGATVDALAHKADVKERTTGWLRERKDAVTSTVGHVTPDGEQVRRGVRSVKTTAERNPLGLALGGAAAGFLAGLLTPSTRLENERLGPVADEVKSTAAEAGREALERGKQVAQTAGEAAIETAKEEGQMQGEELSSTLQDKARELSGSAQDTLVQEPSAAPPRSPSA